MISKTSQKKKKNAKVANKTASVDVGTSVLGNAVVEFDAELKRFVQSVISDVHAVTEALAEPPTSDATNTVLNVHGDDSGNGTDVAAPFLNMLTHATEDAEDTIESIGRISGVTVPRAQTLVAAAVGVYQQQEEAIQELQHILYDLGIPLPPSHKRPHVESERMEQQQQQQVDDIHVPEMNEQEQTRISVDTNTGRVSVVRKHKSIVVDNEAFDDLDGDGDGEPTLLSVPLGLQRTYEPYEPVRQTEDNVDNMSAKNDNREEQFSTKESEVNDDDDDDGLFVTPFKSMEEVTAKVPSFLIDAPLDDINAGVAALNKAYTAQQQNGRECRLTNEEAYAALADERLLFKPQTDDVVLCKCMCV